MHTKHLADDAFSQAVSEFCNFVDARYARRPVLMDKKFVFSEVMLTELLCTYFEEKGIGAITVGQHTENGLGMDFVLVRHGQALFIQSKRCCTLQKGLTKVINKEQQRKMKLCVETCKNLGLKCSACILIFVGLTKKNGQLSLMMWPNEQEFTASHQVEHCTKFSWQ